MSVVSRVMLILLVRKFVITSFWIIFIISSVNDRAGQDTARGAQKCRDCGGKCALLILGCSVPIHQARRGCRCIERNIGTRNAALCERINRGGIPSGIPPNYLPERFGFIKSDFRYRLSLKETSHKESDENVSPLRSWRLCERKRLQIEQPPEFSSRDITSKERVPPGIAPVFRRASGKSTPEASCC